MQATGQLGTQNYVLPRCLPLPAVEQPQAGQDSNLSQQHFAHIVLGPQIDPTGS